MMGTDFFRNIEPFFLDSRVPPTKKFGLLLYLDWINFFGERVNLTLKFQDLLMSNLHASIHR